MPVNTSQVADPPRRTLTPATTVGPDRHVPAGARRAGVIAPASIAGDDELAAPAAAQLYRVRWAVRATLTLGVAASVAANVLHARPHPVAQMIAAWPPLALLLTVELISRVPVHRSGLATLRLAATTAIAGIAGWVSYWHMTAVAARSGETAASAHLLPISVDGLIIVASISLVELAGRIRTTNHPTPSAVAAPPAPKKRYQATIPGTGDPPGAPPVDDGDTRAATPPPPVRRRATPGRPDAAPRPDQMPPDQTTLRSDGRPAAIDRAELDLPAGAGVDTPDRLGPDPAASAHPRRGRPAAATRQLAEQLFAAHPQLTRAQVAQQLGVSPRRLRHVLSTPP